MPTIKTAAASLENMARTREAEEMIRDAVEHPSQSPEKESREETPKVRSLNQKLSLDDLTKNRSKTDQEEMQAMISESTVDGDIDDSMRETHARTQHRLDEFKVSYDQQQIINKSLGIEQQRPSVEAYENIADPYMAYVAYLDTLVASIGIDNFRKLTSKEIASKLYYEFYNKGPSVDKETISQWQRDYDTEVDRIISDIRNGPESAKLTQQENLGFLYYHVNNGVDLTKPVARIYLNIQPGRMPNGHEQLAVFYKKMLESAAQKGLNIDCKVPLPKPKIEKLFKEKYGDQAESILARSDLDGAYSRLDTMVLYFSSDQQDLVLELLDAVYPDAPVRNEVPRFTQEVLPGVGFGQEPPEVGKESFGGLRASILADSIQDLLQIEREERLENFSQIPIDEVRDVVAKKLASRGVSPNNPAFNKGGKDQFPKILERIALSKAA